MADPIIGNFFGLYVGGKRVALAQSKNVSFKTASESITTDDSQGYEEIIPTVHNFSCGADGLVCAHLDNYLQFPEDLSRSIWVKDSGVTVNPTFGSDRKGQKRSNKITFSTGATVSQEITPDAAGTYWASIYAKGSGDILLKLDNGSTEVSTTITLTSNWERYSLSIDGDSDPLIITIEKDSATI